MSSNTALEHVPTSRMGLGAYGVPRLVLLDAPAPTQPTGRYAGSTRVALAASSELVRRGFEALLTRQSSHPGVTVVDADGLGPEDVDVVLVEAHGALTVGAEAERVHRLVTAGFAPVVTFGDDLPRADRQRLRAAGARAHLGLGLRGDELVSALEALPGLRWTTQAHRCPPGAVRHVALELAGCSERESEVLTLICRGLSNNEIAAELYVGVNTVKTYVRTAYRKVGVTTRTRAVLWGLENGL